MHLPLAPQEPSPQKRARELVDAVPAAHKLGFDEDTYRLAHRVRVRNLYGGEERAGVEPRRRRGRRNACRPLVSRNGTGSWSPFLYRKVLYRSVTCVRACRIRHAAETILITTLRHSSPL